MKCLKKKKPSDFKSSNDNNNKKDFKKNDSNIIIRNMAVSDKKCGVVGISPGSECPIPPYQQRSFFRPEIICYKVVACQHFL